MRGVFGRKYLDSRDLGVSLWYLQADLRVPFTHSHREQEEAYVVVAGSGRIRLDDEIRELKLWDVDPRRAGRRPRRSRPGLTASS